ncbi:MAG: hypothetical protein Q9170_007646 [Blastenia crenularia]
MATITTICEEEELPIALMPTIPRLKFHDAPFYFMSEPGITQQEYQKRVWARGRISPDGEDIITVKCPDREDGAGRNFEFRRSVLKRSPTLAKFFESPYYLHGCDMRLTFVVDPAVCLEIAYKYLEEGPDVFQQTILRVNLTMRYKLVDRSVILIRLYPLAQKLALPGLMDMAFGVLSEADPQITATECITFSSLIFARMANFDRKLKRWCIDHITRFQPELEHSTIWQNVLYKADRELSERWAQLLEARHQPHLATVSEDSEPKERPPTATYIPLQFSSPHSTSTARSKEQSFQSVLEEVIHKHTTTAESDEEWETTELLSASAKPHGNMDKAFRVLGRDDKSPTTSGPQRTRSRPRGMTPSPSALFSPGSQKAQFVMGFPGMGERDRRSSSSRRTLLMSPTKGSRKTRLLTGF